MSTREVKKRSIKEISPIDVYMLLPKTNCKECGEENCMAFATKLVNREIPLNQCKPLLKKENEKVFKQLWEMAIETGVLTGMIMLLVGIAATFSYLITVGGVTEFISNLIMSISPAPWFFLIIVSLVFIFIGSVLEGIGALLIFVPVFMPIVQQLQVDPVHFGIVVMASIGLGLFLPPVGVGVLIACGIGGMKASEILKELGIFLLVLYLGILVIIFFPWFTLIVPRVTGF